MTMPVPQGENPQVIPGGAPNSASVPNPIIINNPGLPSQGQQYFTADQLEAARQQEKEKLYNKITKTEQQLKELLADKEKRDAEVEAARLAAEEAAKKEAESRLSAQQLIESREVEFRKQQEEFKRTMDLQFAAMKKEQEFLHLQSFIQRRVAEEREAGTIIPDLVEYISGNTEEEVEASIAKAKEKTASIVRGATTLTSAPIPGVSPTGGPAGPLDALGGPRQLSAEEIAAMPMDKFAEYRRTSGLDRAGNGQGLFG
jgi:hypothetical protein